ALNLSIIKFHFLGDYVQHIREFGTTDSYSTQLGETAHRVVKRFYSMTNKKNAIHQIAKKYRRKVALQPSEEQELLDAQKQSSFKDHHFISSSQNNPINLYSFMNTNPKDPAKKNFVTSLKNHLLGRLLGRTFDGDEESFTPEDRQTVRIRNETIFRVCTARINYTTYDLRRDYDTINPNTHPFLMVASPETDPDAHPFWYAAVIGVFHANVQHIGNASRDYRFQHMEFLWVRWLGVEPGHSSGRDTATLPKIGFVPDTDEYAFGFLDPSLVLRGCHLLPSFVDGRTKELLT
ncbi:hypothetical protein BDN70DRAFT_765144, partial [Pholiota conissans]